MHKPGDVEGLNEPGFGTKNYIVSPFAKYAPVVGSRAAVNFKTELTPIVEGVGVTVREVNYGALQV